LTVANSLPSSTNTPSASLYFAENALNATNNTSFSYTIPANMSAICIKLDGI
jgi:hypothetical protein